LSSGCRSEVCLAHERPAGTEKNNIVRYERQDFLDITRFACCHPSRNKLSYLLFIVLHV
jgi:hypothetical protein